MLNLQWDAAAIGSNNGFTFVDCFGDFYFKAFSGRELEHGVRRREEGIKQLVVWRETHDGDGREKVWEARFEMGHSLVVDHRAIRVIHTSIAGSVEVSIKRHRGKPLSYMTNWGASSLGACF